MVNHHLCLLLRALNDLLIVTCAESSAWSSGSNAFSSIAGVQFLGIPQTIWKVVFVPLTCLGFWGFCSVLLAFRSLAGGAISGACLFCVTRVAAFVSSAFWEGLWL